MKHIWWYCRKSDYIHIYIYILYFWGALFVSQNSQAREEPGAAQVATFPGLACEKSAAQGRSLVGGSSTWDAAHAWNTWQRKSVQRGRKPKPGRRQRKKSTLHTVDGRNPVADRIGGLSSLRIYRVSTIQGGAGFLPSLRGFCLGIGGSSTAKASF